MPKTRAPLLSLEATGKFGPGLYYANTPHGPRAAHLVPPTQPDTIAQEAQRTRVQNAITLWRNRQPWAPNDDQNLAALRYAPKTWSMYNLWLSWILNHATFAKGWDWPLITEIDALTANTLRVWCIDAWGGDPMTMSWGYSPLLASGPVNGSIDPTHGNNWLFSTGFPTPGKTIWFSLAQAPTAPAEGSGIASPVFVP